MTEGARPMPDDPGVDGDGSIWRCLATVIGLYASILAILAAWVVWSVGDAIAVGVWILLAICLGHGVAHQRRVNREAEYAAIAERDRTNRALARSRRSAR